MKIYICIAFSRSSVTFYCPQDDSYCMSRYVLLANLITFIHCHVVHLTSGLHDLIINFCIPHFSFERCFDGCLDDNSLELTAVCFLPHMDVRCLQHLTTDMKCAHYGWPIVKHGECSHVDYHSKLIFLDRNNRDSGLNLHYVTCPECCGIG